MKLLLFLQSSTDWLAYLVEPALRSLALGGMAALVLAVLPVKRAATRLYAWTGVLYVALAMPLLGALLPPLKVAVPGVSAAPIAHSVPQIAEVDARGGTHTAATKKAEFDSGTTQAKARHSPFLLSGPESKSPVTRSSQPRVAAVLWRAAWKIIAPAIYLIGFVILLSRLLLGALWTRRLAHSAKDVSARYFSAQDDIENNRSLAALDFLRSRSRLARLKITPGLKESNALVVPVTLGIWRPVILLPAAWRTWPEEQLQAVLAHEVSHVARRDALTQLLSLIHRAVFCFSPLAWWLNRQLAELAEQASDDAALAGGADRTRYAETLLGFFAQLESRSGRVRWQALSMANRDGAARAERRVDRILDWKGSMSMKKSFVIALIAFAAPVIFLAASVRPFIAHAQSTSESPSPSLTVPPSGGNAPVSQPLRAAQEALSEAKDADQDVSQSGANIRTNTIDHGSRYVMMSGDSNNVSMSGNDEDLRHAEALRKKINGDFIWFERDEKSYVITDPAFMAQAMALFALEGELSKKQDELSQQQDELSRQQDALGEQSEKIKVQIPDITPELERIRSHLKELEAGGATQRELGHIQAQIGQLQSQIGRLQSEAGQQQSAIGRQQGELGRKQGALGKQQGELGRRQGEIARQASRELRSMFDNAIARGIAKPE